jgi:hypothetical protein
MDASSDCAPVDLLGSPHQTELKDTDPTEQNMQFDTGVQDVEENGRY